MKSRVRIKDVAEKAEVSTGTVDRVIHNRGNVNPEVKKKVLKVMEELGFERNLIASALAKNQTFRFGVLLPKPDSDPYWERPFSGIQKASKLVKHYGVIVEKFYFELLNPESFAKEAKKMLKNQFDAILFPPLFLNEGKWLLKECKKKGIPNVMINTNIENADSLCYIGQDSYQSGILAARLLYSEKNDSSSYLILNLTTGSTNAIHLVEKTKGFKDYFKNNGFPNVKVLVEEFGEFNNKRKLRNYLKRVAKNNPDLAGIFFTNSRAYLAIECMDDDFLEKIKIAGFDLIKENIKNLHEGKINYLINQNPFEQGYLGIINLYNHLILKEPIPKVLHLPLDIVVKENIKYYLEREQYSYVI